MKVPSEQSTRDTPQTPHAMLMPDQGTTPMSRNTESLTQAGDFGRPPEFAESASDSPPRALRVMSSAFGNILARKGPRGAERSEAHIEPTVVSVVSRMVAYSGENSAPPRTFCTRRLVILGWRMKRSRRTHNTLPGIDQACFHTAEIAMTPTTWERGPSPLCVYAWSSRPSWARSVMSCGHAREMGRVDRHQRTRAVEMGKRRTTNTMGAWSENCQPADGFTGSGTENETVVADAESGRMKSSVLERGDDGADQANACFSERCSHCTERDTNQASMVGGGSACAGAGWVAGAGSFARRHELERRRPMALQMEDGLRPVEEARLRDFGGASSATGMAGC